MQQVLVQHAKRLALEYPQRFRFEYTQAAETLRLAYWDWAASPTVPPVTVPPTLKIRVPNGNVLREIDVQNPFATFRFPQSALDGKYGSFDSQRRTQIYRCQSPDTYPAGANTRLAKRPYKRWLVRTPLMSMFRGSELTVTVRRFHSLRELCRVRFNWRQRSKFGADSQWHSLGWRLRWSISTSRLLRIRPPFVSIFEEMQDFRKLMFSLVCFITVIWIDCGLIGRL